IDPLADRFASYSPYTAFYNNPVRFTDSRGDAPRTDVENIIVIHSLPLKKKEKVEAPEANAVILVDAIRKKYGTRFARIERYAFDVEKTKDPENPDREVITRKVYDAAGRLVPDFKVPPQSAVIMLSHGMGRGSWEFGRYGDVEDAIEDLTFLGISGLTTKELVLGICGFDEDYNPDFHDEIDMDPMLDIAHALEVPTSGVKRYFNVPNPYDIQELYGGELNPIPIFQICNTPPRSSAETNICEPAIEEKLNAVDGELIYDLIDRSGPLSRRAQWGEHIRRVDPNHCAIRDQCLSK
ncbi:MAG: hypothetical protein AAF570_12945, partial [Bacteroidota bacterium]